VNDRKAQERLTIEKANRVAKEREKERENADAAHLNWLPEWMKWMSSGVTPSSTHTTLPALLS
jgi:hypothetical protein